MIKNLGIMILGAVCFLASQSLTSAQVELAVGDAAPDFEIETLGGDTVTLSSFDQPVILLFSRANW